jgi:hypothetical protein
MCVNIYFEKSMGIFLESFVFLNKRSMHLCFCAKLKETYMVHSIL